MIVNVKKLVIFVDFEAYAMKQITLLILMLTAFSVYSQDKEKEQLLALKKANDHVYQANDLIEKDDYISAEMEYRKAISEQPSNVVGAYNLGTSYVQKGSYEEALYRLEQATKYSTDKAAKHSAFHNIGNILMENEQCKEAVEAYKNALRNDPTDDETRYNLALAKECAENQQGQDQDKKDDENGENEKKEDQEKEQEQDDQDKKDEGDQDKKEGDDKKDEEGKPKDEKQEQKDGDKDKQQQKPQPGQLSPQQIKNLLEAMNNQEQKVQEKMNAEKQKGIKVQTEKDW